MKILYFFLIIFAFFNFSAQSVVFNQTIQVLPGGTMTSADASKANNGDLMSSASSFQLNQAAMVTKVTVYGIQGANTLPSVSKGLIIHIYEDQNGSPAGNPVLQTGSNPIISVDLSNTSPAYSLVNTGIFRYDYSADLTLISGSHVLQPNVTYWLYFVAKINVANISAPTSQTTFYWLNANQGTPIKKCISNMAIAAFCQNWGGNNFPGNAFTIEGITELGTEEVLFDNSGITVYPNPTADFVTIKRNRKIESVSLFDVSGKKIPVKMVENTINLTSLVSGDYFLVLKTDNGDVVKKIIKK